MKKVFLSLAVVAVLTVVSCKKAEAVVEETVEAVEEVATEVVDSAAVAVDTMAAAVESAVEEVAH